MATALGTPTLWARQALAAPQELARGGSRSRIAFSLFVAVNAALLIRPGEIVPEMLGWPIFQVLILACLLAAFPEVVAQLTPAALRERPITACVLGLTLFIPLSLLVQGALDEALGAGFGFAKNLIYFLLLVGLVNSAARLRTFLLWFTVFAAVLVGLILLQAHGIGVASHIQAVREEFTDGATGHNMLLARVRGTGIFGDPNELCLLLVFGMALCVYWLGESGPGLRRYAWLVPLGMFGYTLMLTHSRGGFLAFLAALVTYCYVRFGLARMALVVGLLLPAILLLMGGRQTEFSTSAGTAHDRIGLWSDGLMYVRENPLTGIGFGRFDQRSGLVAHNSFLQCFAELGLLGGVCFFGAFAYAGLSLRRRGNWTACETRLQTSLRAGLVGFVIGIMTVTYSYSMPTYTVLGVVAVFVHGMPIEENQPAPLSGRLILAGLVLSLVFLAGLYVFVQVFK